MARREHASQVEGPSGVVGIAEVISVSVARGSEERGRVEAVKELDGRIEAELGTSVDIGQLSRE